MRETAPLWAYFDIRPSNVDKKTKEGERPVRLVNYTDVYYNQKITSDLELMKATASDEHIERFGVVPGDIIITKDSEAPDDIGIPALITQSSQDMVCAYHLALLRPEAKIADPRFLYRVLESDYAKQHWLVNSYGVTRYSILTGAISRLRVPAYDLATQKHIADYLDRETSEIDAMITKMDELAGHLVMRRQAMFVNVLRRHFDAGTVPIWSFLAPIKDQGHANEEVLSVYRDYGVIPKSSRDDNINRTPEDLSSYQLVLPGDVVINKMKAWQGSMGVSEHRGIVSPDYQVARPIRAVVPRYLHAVLRSQIMIPQYRVRSTGVRPAQWRLYWNDFADLEIPLPSEAVQKRIADHLDEGTSRIDNMLAKVAELKSLLLERRSALVTDVVTGRKGIA